MHGGRCWDLFVVGEYSGTLRLPPNPLNEVSIANTQPPKTILPMAILSCPEYVNIVKIQHRTTILHVPINVFYAIVRMTLKTLVKLLLHITLELCLFSMFAI